MSRPPAHIEIACLSADGVGESAHWAAQENALYWVDITGQKINRLELVSGRRDSWSTPGFPTAFALRRNARGAIVTVGSEVCLFDFDRFETFAIPEPDRPDHRLNEAACDPAGRFWVSTMQTNLNPDASPRPMTESVGRLYCIGTDGAVTLAEQHTYGIPNTMVWRDDDVFVFGDTLAGMLYRFDFDLDRGTLGTRSIFAEIAGPGAPDGSALDAEGYLWNARFGGGCVVRHAPDGSVDRIVELPVTNPTSCAFGGADLATLFVTSARFTLTNAHIAEHPGEGAVLAVDVGVRGLPAYKFGA